MGLEDETRVEENVLLYEKLDQVEKVTVLYLADLVGCCNDDHYRIIAKNNDQKKNNSMVTGLIGICAYVKMFSHKYHFIVSIASQSHCIISELCA